jgi:hypothetical protein
MTAGMVFDQIARYFSEGITPQSLNRAQWMPARAHLLTLVAIRQSRCIEAGAMLNQIEGAILRVRVYVQSRSLEHARFVAKLALAYVRSMIRHDDIRAAASVMIIPEPDRLLGETRQGVDSANFLIEHYVRHAVSTNQMVDVHSVPADTFDAPLDDAAPDDAAPDDDVEVDPFHEPFWAPESDDDDEEDLRFMDGSPLLDVLPTV